MKRKPFLLLLLPFLAAASFAAQDPAVFNGPPAELIPVIGQPAVAGQPMRVLTVEDRMGVARAKDLVRVPLFFHAGECPNPYALALTAEGSNTPVPFQVDDVRKAADGSVARMHIYFYADLKPWEIKRYALAANRAGAAPGERGVQVAEGGDAVTFKGADLSVTFKASGPQAGGITDIRTAFASVTTPADKAPMAPKLKLTRQDNKLANVRQNEISYAAPEGFEVKDIQYAAGPLFAKVRVVVTPKGVSDALETTYIIPAHGSYIEARQRMFPLEGDTEDTVHSIWPVWLQGYPIFGGANSVDKDKPTTLKIPAGVRELTKKTYGFNIESAISGESQFAFMNVPAVIWGDHGVYVNPDGELVFMGPGYMKRNGGSNSERLRSWWHGARYVLAKGTDEAALRPVMLAHMQPLTAIADEPTITIATMEEQSAALAKGFWGIQYWGRGWQQDAAIQFLEGKEDLWRKKIQNPRAGQETEDGWLPGWVKERIAAGDKWPYPNPPGGGDKNVGGAVEPYPVGYYLTFIPVFAKIAPSEKLDAIVLSIARASKAANGRVYDNGWPRINAFANTFNMQIGSVFFGVKQAEDPALAQFYRDVTRSPGVIAINGNGRRNYSGNVEGPGQSDVLYQAVCDFWLRVAELTCDENMMLHPTVYGRYSDSIDVMADMVNRDFGEPVGSAEGPRSNFLRAQSHDHRWESWEAAPHMRMLRDPKEAPPAGFTDSVYYFHHRSKVEKPYYGELIYFFDALAMMRDLRGKFVPPKLLPLPADVKVSAAGNGAQITWSPVPGAVAYRVYRANSKGEPMTFLNSHYLNADAKPITATAYTDPEGSADMFYFVTALDAQGRESHWFPGEP